MNHVSCPPLLSPAVPTGSSMSADVSSQPSAAPPSSGPLGGPHNSPPVSASFGPPSGPPSLPGGPHGPPGAPPTGASAAASAAAAGYWPSLSAISGASASQWSSLPDVAIPPWQDRSIAGPKLRLESVDAFVEIGGGQDVSCRSFLAGCGRGFRLKHFRITESFKNVNLYEIILLLWIGYVYLRGLLFLNKLKAQHP